ncbi:F-box protein [Aspergillus mulundensis]|uniref:F-box domain-containing protein n=1 Tax=Aspergillus mulundensis TaxID=1810919 RepID=A0A3D8SIG1_9EURO|nr:hypothetical protein DSM5745_02718 [Aspergillus mulundensis]RDW86076.1 hypothetical protein DSM5745_02718 [Aspergillus mulundensis]
MSLSMAPASVPNQPAEASRSPISALPPESISRIAGFLDLKDLCSLRLANKNLCKLFETPFQSSFNTRNTDLSRRSLERLHFIANSHLAPHVKTLRIAPRPNNQNGNKIGEDMNWGLETYGDRWVDGLTASSVKYIIERLVNCDGFIFTQVGADHGRHVQLKDHMLMVQVPTHQVRVSSIVIADAVHLFLTIITRLRRQIASFTVDLRATRLLLGEMYYETQPGGLANGNAEQGRGYTGRFLIGHGIGLRGIQDCERLIERISQSYIQDLQLNRPGYHPFSTLRSLTLRLPIDVQQHADAMRQFILGNPDLEFLALSVAQGSQANAAGSGGKFLRDIIEYWNCGYKPRLRWLNLHGAGNIPIRTEKFMAFLWRHGDTLQMLDLVGINLISNIERHEWETILTYLQQPEFKQLKVFRLWHLVETRQITTGAVANRRTRNNTVHVFFDPKVEKHPIGMIGTPRSDGPRTYTSPAFTCETCDYDCFHVSGDGLFGRQSSGPRTPRRCKVIRGINYDDSGLSQHPPGQGTTVSKALNQLTQHLRYEFEMNTSPALQQRGSSQFESVSGHIGDTVP